MSYEMTELQNNYRQLMKETIASIDALIYEVEENTLQNKALRQANLEMATDTVPLIRSLKEAKKQAEISLSIFGQKKLKLTKKR